MARSEKLPTPAPRADRQARRDALLDAAAAEFNARGVSRASLSRIAETKGLTRAAIYYYVADLEDLVFEVYRKSCETMARDLALAVEAGGDALEQLSAFVHCALDPQRPPMAVLSELDVLSGDPRAAIDAAHDANVAALRRVIRAGVEAGDIRTCDDEIIAQTIIGMLAWAPVSADWVEGEDDRYRDRVVEAMVDLLLNGQGADPEFELAAPIGIDAFVPPAPDPFDRAAVAEAKLEQLLRVASQVFNRRGVDGASLDDVVGALGATKGVLYHYLDNKTDLVVRCQERATTLYEKFVDAADRLGGTGLEKGLIGLWLLVQAQSCGLSPLIQTAGNESLPEGARRALRRRNRAIQQRYEGFGKLGIDDGSFRQIDVGTVSQLGAGAFQWLPKWFGPQDARAAKALPREIVRLFTGGLRRR